MKLITFLWVWVCVCGLRAISHRLVSVVPSFFFFGWFYIISYSCCCCCSCSVNTKCHKATHTTYLKLKKKEKKREKKITEKHIMKKAHHKFYSNGAEKKKSKNFLSYIFSPVFDILLDWNDSASIIVCVRFANETYQQAEKMQGIV